MSISRFDLELDIPCAKFVKVLFFYGATLTNTTQILKYVPRSPWNISSGINLLFWFLFNFKLYGYRCLACSYVCHHVPRRYIRRLEDSIGSPGTGVIGVVGYHVCTGN